MDKRQLRDRLTASLSRLYEGEAFACLADFLQGEISALYHLSQSRGAGMNPSALSEKLRVSRSRITATLSALRKKGFVTLRGSEDDRRRIWVTLTPEGAEFLRRKQQKVEEYFDRLVEGLGEANVLDLIRLIDLSIQIASA
ncbi:MAG TPA: MarR family transcriptional regulator [Firmicutes bacterium]|nr:MarR family transcriptional regulator [Candidatus Fermentithermobacillaceae bacterium]